MKFNNKPVKYEDRFVAFIDILGFKNIIKRSNSNEDILIKITEALNSMKSIERSEIKEFYNETNWQIALFSDNIVISYPIDERDSEFRIMEEAMYLQILLLTKGILVRGGITKGKIYHKENLVFGPALVRAYELESKYAIYPRIIVDDIMNPSGFMIATDFDGIKFIDSLVQHAYYTGLGNLYNIYSCIDKTVKEYLLDINDTGVKSKLKWLENYCNQSFCLTETDVKIFIREPLNSYERVYKNCNMYEGFPKCIND